MSDYDSTDDLLRLTREVRNYRRPLEIQRRLAGECDIDQLPAAVMVDVSSILGAERSSLFVFDPRAMEFRASYAQGVDGQTISVRLDMGLVGAAILLRRLLNIPDANDHPFFNPQIDTQSGYFTESVLVVPVQDEASGEAIGCIELLNKYSGRFSDVDEAAIRNAACQWAHTVATGFASEETAQTLIACLKEDCGCDRGSVFMLDARSAVLGAVFVDGAEASALQLNMRLGIAGFVAVTGRTINVPDVSADARFDPSNDARAGFQTRSVLCVPMNSPRGEVFGALQVINKVNGGFNDEDEETLKSVAGVLAITIENLMMFADQELQVHSLLNALAASIDAKHTLAAGHSKGVARFASTIARRLRLGEREIDVVEVATILHDYGKIAVADVFGALTVDRHYRKGVSIDEAFRFLDAEDDQKYDRQEVDALKTWVRENPATADEVRAEKADAYD